MKTKRLLLLQVCIILLSFSAMAETFIYQAEAKTDGLNATAATTYTGFYGSAYVEMTNVAGNYLEWNNIDGGTSGGAATLRFRYCNGDSAGANRDLAITVNGNLAGTYLCPLTGWGTWVYTAQFINVTLNAGVNTVRVTLGSQAKSPKIDEMEVVIGAPTVVDVSSVVVDPGSFGILVGKTATLKAKVLPVNATDKTVSWASDNTNVITIDPLSGALNAVAEGTANVTATSTSGSFVGTCPVKVYPTNVSIGTNPNLILNPGFEDGLTWWSNWGGFAVTSLPILVASGTQAGYVPDGTMGGFAQDVNLPVGAAGKTFLFSVKLKTSDLPQLAQTGCKLYEGSTELNSPFYVTIENTDIDFTSYSWIVSTTAATTKAQIWVWKNTTGGIHLDDYSFAEVSTSTRLNAKSEVKTICYLNAGNNQLSVKNNEGIHSVNIFNVNGQSLLTKTVNSIESILNVSNLSNGLYIVKANLQDGKSEFIKVLKN